LNNDLRQRRFRAREQKVTHHGSGQMAAPAVLAVTRTTPDAAVGIGGQRRTEAIYCHRCGSACDPYLRRDFLRSRVRRVYPP
jgi:hypothetical protein